MDLIFNRIKIQGLDFRSGFIIKLDEFREFFKYCGFFGFIIAF